MLTRKGWPTPMGLGLKLMWAMDSYVTSAVTPDGNGTEPLSRIFVMFELGLAELTLPSA